MWSRVCHLLEMIRFSHTVFALPFALSAAAMAWRVPPPQGKMVEFRWRDLLAILLCMVCARSAAMAFNRLADRKIDARNPRTQGRHLPAGTLSVASVVLFAATMSVGLVLSTLLFHPNWIPFFLAVPLLVFLFGYSYTKRFTWLSHFWLGTALMLAPVAAWISIRGGVLMGSPLDVLPAVVLGVAVLLWVAGFDMIYACLDVEFDVSARLHSVPARWGVPTALRLAACCHLGMVLALFMLPWSRHAGGPPLPFGGIYWSGIALVALLLLYEHALVRPDDLSRVNVAFFYVNAVISFGLLAVIILDLHL